MESDDYARHSAIFETLGVIERFRNQLHEMQYRTLIAGIVALAAEKIRPPCEHRMVQFTADGHPMPCATPRCVAGWPRTEYHAAIRVGATSAIFKPDETPRPVPFEHARYKRVEIQVADDMPTLQIVWLWWRDR